MRLVLININLFAPIFINILTITEYLFYTILIGIIKLLLFFPSSFYKFNLLNLILILSKVETFLRFSLFLYYFFVSPYFLWLLIHLFVDLALTSVLDNLAFCNFIYCN